MGLIYGDNQEPLAKGALYLGVCPPPALEGPPLNLEKQLRLMVEFSTCPPDPSHCMVFFFLPLIFKEAYLQREGRVSQGGDGGGRENKPEHAKSSILHFE